MGIFRRVLARADLVLLNQRGHLFPWAPVFLAIGIGWYFSLRMEPVLAVYGCVALIGLTAVAAAIRWPSGLSAIGWALALVAFGFCLAGNRAHQVGGPVLGWRYYGPIEGRVVGLDRSASDAVRVTLDRVRLERVGPDRRPDRVRISLHGPAADIRPGQRIMTTGHLSPPQGPVEPGGFDFRRHAWFQGLGAVGYTRTPVLLAAPAIEGRAGVKVLAIRMAASNRVRELLPGDVGGFAAAVTTGDRSGVGQDALDALRASNLAHLLAISGLHMGLLAGFVFAALRVGLSLVPAFALRFPVKKVAALGALGAAAGYLALSGGNVATERAFIMVAVVLIAVLVDRRAFSLRAVAMAALIVLVLRPEALLGPGFQMSFAATTALVAFFGWLRDADLPRAPNFVKPVLGVVLSSAIAGLATAPVGAAHFNTMSHYGLIANLLSVPLMGILVIPAAVLALLLAPFGLEMVGLYPMGMGLRWILGVAHFVTDLDGAQGYVPGPGHWVLPMLSLGCLWVMLWQGRARLAGLAPVVLAFLLWAQTERPAVLVADTGGLVGVMTAEGRALSKARGAGFIAGNWLENDGDGSDQPTAAGRWPGAEDKVRTFSAGPIEIVHVIGKTGAARMDSCAAGQIVVASVPLRLKGPCEVYDSKRLLDTGSLAISGGMIVTAQERSGRRIWNTPPGHKAVRLAQRQ
ncbi:ComEC/Rec2 family competence protein [Sedimentitalea sp. JM2-8]|uniref:ComEC/Rec2 family competence protein n=1 Tax=Sedimentitalea xiamensis TaxID=3050037 RepID=A0ABT7FBJ8_9RHOB|nr:ComEC/Rec2 family competence protein [Sedimentitalea xiamensis]MDK3072469.1 ComEC/Rec2 family competence protein [Sedimentitalea xiamensis]